MQASKVAKRLQYFSEEQLAGLDKARVPHHVAIIPDGNRRWARSRFFLPFMGHEKGAENVITIAKAAKELGIQAITLYLFSTENWSRDSFETTALMQLFERFAIQQRPAMLEHGIRFHMIGAVDKLPAKTLNALETTCRATSNCSDIDVIAALNYGSRDELKRAFLNIIDDIDQKKLTKEMITEKMISNYLDTSNWPDPELLIRTSGEFRISNFLLWQLSYAEMHIARIHWPDFTPQHLLEALLSYQNRERRQGGGG